MKNRIILLILFILTGCFGLFLAIKQQNKTPLVENKAIAQLKQPTNLLIQNNKLLRFENVDILKIQNNSVILNQISLTFKKDTIQGFIYDIPQNEDTWRGFLIERLGDNKNFERVISTFKQTFKQEWESINKQKSWNKLSEVQQCCHVLVNSLETNQSELIYLANKDLFRLPKSNLKAITSQPLELISSQTLEEPTKSEWTDWVLPIGLLLISVLGILLSFRHQIEITDKAVIEEKQEDEMLFSKIPPVTVEEVKSELNDDLILRYFQNFQERYGDFYTKIEQLPEFPSDELTKQKIKNQLVEMGLHAHSLSRAFLFNYLDRPEKEPNILLIQNKQNVVDLDDQHYKKLSFDAYQTNKRYRFLAKILIEMNIGSLEGALLSDTYLPKELLAQPQ